MSGITCETQASLQAAVVQDGFAFVQGSAMREILGPFGSWSDWQRFADSWNDLRVDTYMADGGRYRRRRHAVYVAGETVDRAPHQPHYQALDYNPLNGGIARWFEPIAPDVADGPTMRTILTFCRSLFDSVAPLTRELAGGSPSVPDRGAGGEEGRPTPEAPCIAMASTMCWCCWSSARTSPASTGPRFMAAMGSSSATSRSPSRSMRRYSTTGGCVTV